MIKFTQNLSQWLFENHKDKMGSIMLGHTELFTEEMAKQYVIWCQTEEGKRHLKGGSQYKEGKDEDLFKI